MVAPIVNDFQLLLSFMGNKAVFNFVALVDIGGD